MVAKTNQKGARIILGLLIALSILIMSACSNNSETENSNENSNEKSEKTVKIGISQIVEHPVLDLARKGFVDKLQELGFEDGKNIEIDVKLAQGDMALTNTISSGFVSDKKDLILAISTPSAQGALNSTKEIPLLFTAVTDPVAAGLVKDPSSPDGNITGTIDMTPVKENLELGKSLVKDAKNVGMIYNTSEVNSQVQVDLAKSLSSDLGLNIVEIPVTTSSDIIPALTGHIDEVDFIFLPADNLVASSISIITKTATDSKVPVIGADSPMVEAGAIGCVGLDYYELGLQTGQMAADILDGKDISQIPVQKLEKGTLMINMDSASKLGIEIPSQIKENAKLIGGN